MSQTRDVFDENGHKVGTVEMQPADESGTVQGVVTLDKCGLDLLQEKIRTAQLSFVYGLEPDRPDYGPPPLRAAYRPWVTGNLVRDVRDLAAAASLEQAVESVTAQPEPPRDVPPK